MCQQSPCFDAPAEEVLDSDQKNLSYLFILCSNLPMADSPCPETLLAETVLAFTPVPAQRKRGNGWSPMQQERFIRALGVMGSVGPAARAVGMGRASAYRLRERAGAESFARAWDEALDQGRARMFDYAMDRAINGVTTVRVQRGGSVTVSNGPDMKLVYNVIRDSVPPTAAVKATKESDSK
jgi:hypothetical protein